MGMTLWVVSGSFMVPGTREKGSFGPLRIADVSRQAASKHVAVMLREQYRKELNRANKHGGPRFDFGDNFAMMNLQWRPFVSHHSSQELIQPMVHVPVDDRNDPPAL